MIPAPEGIAPDHTQLVDFGTTPGDKVMAMVNAGEVEDEVAAATYLAFDQTRKRITVALVSDGIPDSEARKIGITATTDFNKALAAALARHGNKARIGVVTQGADIMAQFTKKGDAGRMPRFAANLSMMFNEVPFLDRFQAAAAAGFKAVEFLFPYEYSAEEVEKQGQSRRNRSCAVQHAGRETGAQASAALLACLGARTEFREGVEKALAYAERLGTPRLHAMAGIAPAGADLAACRATLIANLQYAAEKLAAKNITLLLEAINTRDMPGFIVSTQKESHAICESSGRAEPEDADGSLSHAGDGRRSCHKPQALRIDVRPRSDCRMPRASRARYRRSSLRVSLPTAG